MLNTPEDFERFFEEAKPEIHAALKTLDSSVLYWRDEEPTWHLTFSEDEDICVDFHLFNGEVCAGEDEGYNAGWTACERSGLILANCIPYNYSKWVWTRDEDELRQRIDGTLKSLADWVAREAWEDA